MSFTRAKILHHHDSKIVASTHPSQTAIMRGLLRSEKLLDKHPIHELKALSNGGVLVGQRPASGRS
jgi:hypothetical protein